MALARPEHPQVVAAVAVGAATPAIVVAQAQTPELLALVPAELEHLMHSVCMVESLVEESLRGLESWRHQESQDHHRPPWPPGHL